MNRRLFIGAIVCAANLWFTSVAAFGQDAVEGTDYRVPMRDGVKLSTTVFLPEGDGPWPAIVTRTPYNKARYQVRVGL